VDPYSQPTHRRTFSSSSTSPTAMSVFALPPYAPHPTHGVPIPRPPSQIHRPMNVSGVNTPLSHSPSSSESQSPFSPITSTNPASFLSNNTNLTSPPSSGSLNSNPPAPYGAISRVLSYPSVPPPSLSSSYGSPTVSYHMPHRDHSLSPVEPLNWHDPNARRGSFDRRIAESGSLMNMSHTNSRRGSVERGARVAETGTLVPRSRAGSHSLSSTSEAANVSQEKGIGNGQL
jgi:hypothetical protein